MKKNNSKSVKKNAKKVNVKIENPLAGQIKKSKVKISFGKPLIWIKQMSVEEPNIDAQHHKLIEGVNMFLEVVKSEESIKKIRELIHFMDNYVKIHFSYEESYMARIGYPKLELHKKIHQSFVEYYLSFKTKLNKELMNKDSSEFVSDKVLKMISEAREYVSSWLKNHMLGDDQGFHSYAREHHLIGKKLKDIKIKDKSAPNNIAAKVKAALIGVQKAPLTNLPDLKDKTMGGKKYIFTGIEGFDGLLGSGIPQGSSVIIAGGAGSGKTIFCLQTLVSKAKEGKKCLYLTLEENEERLVSHMQDFGWNGKDLIKKGKLKILRVNPFDITRNVDAMLAKQKGELLIDVDPVLLPKEYAHPDFIVVDSLTAIASAFTGKDDSYRIYIEQLFRFLEKIGATSFLITETEQVPKIFSTTGVEEFLADGVVVLYALKHGNVRENALEILKLRGTNHKKNIVAMQITDNGIVVYPEQEVFSDLS
jgi:hemerythrin-like metal-binding protein